MSIDPVSLGFDRGNQVRDRLQVVRFVCRGFNSPAASFSMLNSTLNSFGTHAALRDSSEFKSREQTRMSSRKIMITTFFKRHGQLSFRGLSSLRINFLSMYLLAVRRKRLANGKSTDALQAARPFFCKGYRIFRVEKCYSNFEMDVLDVIFFEE